MTTTADTATIKLPRPHAAQMQILKHQGSSVVFAGRRVGKTQVGVYRILKEATNDDKVGLYWWVGLSWRSASMKRAWRLLKFYARKIWKAMGEERPDRKFIREAEKEIYLPNGSAIWLRSAEREDSLAGEGIRGVVVDEFSLMAETVWTEYLEATLIDYEGWALFLGIPKGMNWAAVLWMNAKDRKGWKQFHFTIYDNPHMSRERIAEIEANTIKTVFEQEYLAKITQDGGAVFRGVSQVLTAPMHVQPIDHHRYIFGIDWGRSNDYTVIFVLDATTRQMVAMDRFNEVGFPLQRGRIKRLYDIWKPAVIYAEENSIGLPNIEELQADGLPVRPFYTGPTTKAPLIEALALAIEQQAIALQDDSTLVGELIAYTQKRRPGGSFTYDAPSGLHDDCVIAAALAWHGVISVPSWSSEVA